MSRIERELNIKHFNYDCDSSGQVDGLVKNAEDTDFLATLDADDFESSEYQEEIDLIQLRLDELKSIQTLKPEEQLECGRKIFAGQLSLRNLDAVRYSDLLTADQQLEINTLFSDKRACFLFKHFNRKIKRETKHSQTHNSQENGNSKGDKLAQIADSHLEELDKKLKVVSQIDSDYYKRQVLDELINQQIKTVKDGMDAHSLLVLTNWRLPFYFAKRARQSISFDIPLMDLWDYGDEGLLIAAARYDYFRGYRFSTYASYWIKQAIGRGIDNTCSTIRLPMHVRERIKNLLKKQAILTQEFGYEPDIAELARQNDTPLNMLTSALLTHKTLSLDYKVHGKNQGDDDFELVDLIPDNDQNLEESGFNAILKGEIRKVLELLTPRERKVIELRFGLEDGRPMTLEEISRQFQVTRERIRQIESKALKKLRNPNVSKKLYDYYRPF